MVHKPALKPAWCSANSHLLGRDGSISPLIYTIGTFQCLLCASGIIWIGIIWTGIIWIGDDLDWDCLDWDDLDGDNLEWDSLDWG